MMMMMSDHLAHDLISLFGLCATLLTVSEELSIITWNYTHCNLQIACNKFSSKSKYTRTYGSTFSWRRCIVVCIL